MRPDARAILVGVDFSDSSRRAFDYAAWLSSMTEAKLTLLHVWMPPHYIAPDVMLTLPDWNPTSLETAGRREAEKKLESFLSGVDRTRVRLESLVETGEPARCIVRVAQEKGCDLVIVGTHNRKGLDRILVGSVAQRVLAHATCEVMVVRPRLADGGHP